MFAEAALVLPLLVAIAFFITELGNVLYLTNSVNQITREAARYASVTPAYTYEDLIRESGAADVLPDVSKLTLTSDPAPGATRAVGTKITIMAEYNYTPIINPFRILNLTQTWIPVIRSTSVARAEVSNA